MSKKMLKIMFAVIIFLAGALPAFGDEVDAGLPESATVELRESTREMIRVGLDGREAIEMTRTMLENRFRPEHILRAQRIVMQALEDGLPPKPILNKAREGMVKQVQQKRIIQAMEKVRSRYEFAAQHAGRYTQVEAVKTRLMEQVAGCAAAGMTDHDLERLSDQLAFRAREMQKDQAADLAEETFRMVKTMARLHVTSVTAADAAITALANRYGTREIKAMRRSFVKHGRDSSPNRVAEAYVEAIRERRNLETLDSSDMDGMGHTGGIVGSGGSGGSSGHGSGSGQGGGGPGRGAGGARGGRH